MPTGIYKRSIEHKRKISRTMKGKKPKNFEYFLERSHETLKKTGEGAAHWLGDNVGYTGVHIWLNKNYGQPKRCDWCKTTTAKRYEWANKSHSFKRDITEYIRLCTSCHRKYDHPSNKI